MGIRAVLAKVGEAALVAAAQSGAQQAVQQAGGVLKLPGQVADLARRVEQLEAAQQKRKGQARA